MEDTLKVMLCSQFDKRIKRLQSYPQEYVLPFLREVQFLEEGFVLDTQVFCASIQGIIYPIEVLETLVETAFDVNRGLVAYCPFNSNTNDESGNGNHGTVHNATLADDRFGNAGRAYRFNGRDSFIEIAEAPGLDFTKEVTISVWVYFEGATPADDPIVEKPQRSWGQYALWITEDKANFGIYPASGDKLQWLTSKQSLIRNEWNHLAGTYDGKQLALYINGKADNVTPSAVNTSTSDEPLYIGDDPYGDKTFVRDVIDDVRIYNRSLSEAEVQALYQEIEPFTQR